MRADNAGAPCSGERLQQAQRLCSNPQGVAVLQRQHLFSVYLHPLPEFGAFPEESIFHGREIPDRMQARIICSCKSLTSLARHGAVGRSSAQQTLQQASLNWHSKFHVYSLWAARERAETMQSLHKPSDWLVAFASLSAHS